MKRFRMIAMILAVTMLFSGCQTLLDIAMSNLTGDDWTQYSLTFSEMTYTRPDMTAFQASLDEACQLAETSNDPEAIMEKVYDYYAAYDNFETMYYLTDIRYSMDLTDGFYQEEYEYCAGQLSYVDSTLEDLWVALANCSVVDELEDTYFDEGFFDDYRAPEGSGEDWEYESVWNEEFMELNNRESSLVNQYYAAQEELTSLNPYSGDYYTKYAEKMGSIYIDLITVRQEIAQYAGFSTYEEYANQWYYNRMDTASQIDAYIEEIKTHLVPLYRTYCGSDQWDWMLTSGADEEDCLNYVESAARNMSGVVEDAYDSMIERELYDISPSKNKAATSFEIYLVNFSAPFILMNPEENMGDLLTLAHEFGHFANDYAAYGTYASSDVAEVLSQGMEYLSLCYADSLNEEDMENLRQVSMMNSLSTYVEQMAYYSFERQAYQLTGDELTVENLCALYDQVAEDFGFEAVSWDSAEWATVPHFFQHPLYVYSYVVSNDAAMQIYQLEQEKSGEGLALYNELVYEWEDIPLADYREKYELQAPTAEGRVEALAETFRQVLR